jgi:hypothetical protein
MYLELCCECSCGKWAGIAVLNESERCPRREIERIDRTLSKFEFWHPIHLLNIKRSIHDMSPLTDLTSL